MEALLKRPPRCRRRDAVFSSPRRGGEEMRRNSHGGLGLNPLTPRLWLRMANPSRFLRGIAFLLAWLVLRPSFPTPSRFCSTQPFQSSSSAVRNSANFFFANAIQRNFPMKKPADLYSPESHYKSDQDKKLEKITYLEFRTFFLDDWTDSEPGKLLVQHRDEILSLARRQEQRQNFADGDWSIGAIIVGELALHLLAASILGRDEHWLPPRWWSGGPSLCVCFDLGIKVNGRSLHHLPHDSPTRKRSTV